MKAPSILLPRGWLKRFKQALQSALGLERTLLLEACGDLSNSRDPRARLIAENARLQAQLEAMKEELRIKDARLRAIPARQRPFYPPAERLAILILRAKMGWTLAETARRFLVTPATIARWLHRLDERGPDALVQTRQPVNRFPDFLALATENLQRATGAGKRRLADIFARLGIVLAASTAARLRQRARTSAPLVPEPPSKRPSEHAAQSTRSPNRNERARRVTARRPHEVWHVDLTLLPTTGFWLPWWPFALPVVFPYCFWLCVVLDHFSRSVVAWRLFGKEPTSSEVCRLLDDASGGAGQRPKYTVTDQGTQFRSEFRTWCAERGVAPRFGALGEHGSIAVIERFFRSLKAEMLWRLPLVPLSFDSMHAEVACYMNWYNTARVHHALGGLTPAERREGVVRRVQRLEPRARYPIRDGAARVDKVELVIDPFEGRKHLPIVSLRRAA